MLLQSCQVDRVTSDSDITISTNQKQALGRCTIPMMQSLIGIQQISAILGTLLGLSISAHNKQHVDLIGKICVNGGTQLKQFFGKRRTRLVCRENEQIIFDTS